MARPKKPTGTRNLTDEDWRLLRNELVEVFTPGQPINEFDLFAGRADQIRSLQDATLEPSRHAIVYGERGVGKTSIANIFHRSLNTDTRSVRNVPVNANRSDTFSSLWTKTFKRIHIAGNGEPFWMDQAFPDAITPDDVQMALSNFSLNELRIIIFDGYDRLNDMHCKVLMTYTIKALSDYGVNCTIVLVGVAESISSLVAEHASISRALKQIPMPRMSQDELTDIVVRRLRKTPLHIADDALWRIAYFSRGLPFFTHSLGKYACFRAIEKRHMNISEQDVFTATE
jgi:Cdc6-like AAA superfamily ATPase